MGYRSDIKYIIDFPSCEKRDTFINMVKIRGDAHEVAAQGHFVHVYVDRETRRPVPLPEALRAVLEPLVANVAA